MPVVVAWPDFSARRSSLNAAIALLVDREDLRVHTIEWDGTRGTKLGPYLGCQPERRTLSQLRERPQHIVRHLTP